MDNIKLDFQKHIDVGRCNGAEWIINHKNNIYHEVIGYKDLELKNKLNKNSYYRIWSMTKPIVAVAALQLIEENKIGDVVLGTWLPPQRFSNRDWLRWDDQLVPSR